MFTNDVIDIIPHLFGIILLEFLPHRIIPTLNICNILVILYYMLPIQAVWNYYNALLCIFVFNGGTKLLDMNFSFLFLIEFVPARTIQE